MNQHRNYEDILRELAPSLEEDATSANHQQMYFALSVITTDEFSRAARMITVLACSDLGDLIDEVLLGSGRAAIRTARSLIEHSVNLHTVLTSEDAAERYMAHLDLGAVMLDGAPGADRLKPKLRRKVVRLANREAHKARPRWESALERFGPRFNVGWHPSNLHDRAKDSGRTDLYDLFRLCSLVAHGSSAGAISQYHLHDSDRATYAAGRVPALVPLAFVVGVEAFIQLLVHLRDATTGFEIDPPASAVGLLLRNNIDSVWEASISATTAMLPEATVAAHLAFSARGKLRWYLETSELPERWLRAKDSTTLDETADWLQPVRAAYVEKSGPFNEGGWASIEVPGLSPFPDWNQNTIPADAMPRIVPLTTGEWATGTFVGRTVVGDGWIVHPPL